jgi:hypothetical protein
VGAGGWIWNQREKITMDEAESMKMRRAALSLIQ